MNALTQLIATLRGENGCPWDKKQTPQTMVIYLLEEVYELVEAIESGNPEDVCEELGDVLFQVLFISQLFQEAGHFDLEKVVNVNTEKMRRRHPHVFGDEKVETPEEVKRRWHKIKLAEKKQNQKKSLLDGVPAKLPPMSRAFRVSERAARAGFDWNDIAGVIQKVQEEWAELMSALKQPSSERDPISAKSQEDPVVEFGDVLFTLINVGRFARIHPETALIRSVKKFEKRFRCMEKEILSRGKNFESISHKEWDLLWEAAKRQDG
jgi:tetrapyrrole methylase family protein/MazG family protein